MPSGPRPDLLKPRQRLCACTVVYRKPKERLGTRRLSGHRRDEVVIQLLDHRDQAGLPEEPRARSCCTPEACKMPV